MFVLATPLTDQVSASSAAVAAAFAVIATLVAWRQLSGLRDEARLAGKQVEYAGNQVKLAADQITLARQELRMSGLMAVLEIESQISDRKVKLDELNREIQSLGQDLDAASTQSQRDTVKAKIAFVQPFFDSACENYLNAFDRLCYCILKGYLADRDWRTEYRNNILGIIQTYSDYFKAGSHFRNILEINNQWQAA